MYVYINFLWLQTYWDYFIYYNFKFFLNFEIMGNLIKSVYLWSYKNRCRIFNKVFNSNFLSQDLLEEYRSHIDKKGDE